MHVDDSFALHRMLHGAETSRQALGALRQSARERLVDDVGQFLAELGTSAVPSLAACVLPLERAVTALETSAADMAVARLGHVAVDIAPLGTTFGSGT